MGNGRRWGLAACGVATVAGVLYVATREPDYSKARVTSLSDLERELEALRQHLQIPGMSAAIGERGSIAWARGFGMADLERRAAATPDTIYPLASSTKPYGSTVLLQLADEGRVDLNAPVSDFGITIERPQPVRVWHLLSHTSSGEPGTRFRYDGNAFGRLDVVIERASGHSFAKEISDRIIRPLGLTRTAPYPGDIHGFSSLLVSLTSSREDLERARRIFGDSGLDRGSIQSGLATGYVRAWGRTVWPPGLLGPMRPMTHGIALSPAGGLVASAPDVVRFSSALDAGRLLKDSTRQRAWSAVVTPDGRTLPYGLGWFVQEHNGSRIVWHYGHYLESSSIIVKFPAEEMTFIVLANSEGLSRRRRLGDTGNILASPAARLFLAWHATRHAGTPAVRAPS